MKCVTGNPLDLEFTWRGFRKGSLSGRVKKLKSFAESVRCLEDQMVFSSETHWDGALWRIGFIEKFPGPLHFSQVIYIKILQHRHSKGKVCVRQAIGQCSEYILPGTLWM